MDLSAQWSLPPPRGWFSARDLFMKRGLGVLASSVAPFTLLPPSTVPIQTFLWFFQFYKTRVHDSVCARSFTIHNVHVLHTKMSTKSPPSLRSWRELCTDSVICHIWRFMLVVGSLRPRFSVDSEAVHAGVLWMTPVRQHPHLDDLEGPFIFLLKEKKIFRTCLQTMNWSVSNRLRSTS